MPLKKKIDVFEKQLFPIEEIMPIKGKILNIDNPGIYYQHRNGVLYWGDCVEYMRTLNDESVDMIFADPPYNIGKDKWDSWKSMNDYILWSEQWIKEAARILKKNGTMYICGFSEIIALIQTPAMKYFHSCKWTIWYYRNKANLSNDWGRSHEAVLCFRKSKDFKFNVDHVRIPYNLHTTKYPERGQGETSQYGGGKREKDSWSPNPLGAKPRDVIDMPTTCNGMSEKTPHKTQKPEELVRKYILASSNEGDIVLDPFCGSGTTPVCCEQLNRKWLSCDLEREYLGWATDRISGVTNHNIDFWIAEDKSKLNRREGIRNNKEL